LASFCAPRDILFTCCGLRHTVSFPKLKCVLYLKNGFCPPPPKGRIGRIGLG
jgi:hypothetical protein